MNDTNCFHRTHPHLPTHPPSLRPVSIHWSDGLTSQHVQGDFGVLESVRVAVVGARVGRLHVADEHRADGAPQLERRPHPHPRPRPVKLHQLRTGEAEVSWNIPDRDRSNSTSWEQGRWRSVETSLTERSNPPTEDQMLLGSPKVLSDWSGCRDYDMRNKHCQVYGPALKIIHPNKFNYF